MGAGLFMPNLLPINFFKALISYDKEYWTQELKLNHMKLNRMNLKGKDWREADLAHMAALAIIMEMEEMEKDMAEARKYYRSFVVFGSWKEKNDGTKWPNFYTFRNVLVEGEENRGPQEKSLSIKFNPAINLKNFGPGFLVCEKSKCIVPKVYKITTDEKGVKHYPYIWVDEIFSFDPYTIEEEENEDEK